MSKPSETVFVFGSNRQGRHGKGAALHAVKKWGAIYGQAVGRQGNAYAIITKELRRDQPPVTLDEVGAGVRDFLHYAIIYPSIRFKVSAIGCGLAGFTPEDIAPLFLWRGNSEPRPNVILPPEFKEVLKNGRAEEPAQELRYTQSPTAFNGGVFSEDVLDDVMTASALPSPYRWQELSQVPQYAPRPLYFGNPDGTIRMATRAEEMAFGDPQVQQPRWTTQSLADVMNAWDRVAGLAPQTGTFHVRRTEAGTAFISSEGTGPVHHTLPTLLPGCAPPIQESPEFRRLVNALQQPMPMWGDEPTGADIRMPLHARFPDDDIHDDEAPF